MTNIDHTAQIIADVFRPLVKGHANAMGRDLATKLAAAGLLAPEPQIIRTLADLESLDPDTILLDCVEPYTAGHAVDAIYEDDDEGRDYVPAVVIATGDHIRAARQALEDGE